MAGSAVVVGLMVSLMLSHGTAFLVAPEQRHPSDRFTEAAVDGTPLAEDEEAASVISTEKQRTAREAVSAAGLVSDSANVSRLIERLMYGYDKRLRPNYKGDPVEVLITMFVSSVSSISEVNMDFTLDFYFRQHWHDARLNFNDTGENELCISNEMLDKIWWPDTFFANAKSAHFHTATTKNAFVRISPSGWITQSLRLTVTAMCRMNLKLFPMDTQVCSLEIESYAYSVKHITYKWQAGPTKSVSLADEVQLPQVQVKGYRVKEKLEVLSTGNYSRLACEFYFVRSLGYYIIQIYVPSSLIVVLSWVSFWLHRDAAPARVALGITTVLTMTTLISSTNAALPKISYLKSIDVYLVACFVMVFASIVEFAAVSYIGHIRPAISELSSAKKPNGTCNRLQETSTLVDDQVASDAAGRSAVVIVNRDASRQQSTSRRHFSIPNNASSNSTQNVCQSSIRKLYTDCDLRRIDNEGLQSCSSRVVQTPNISVPPAVTDTLTAVPPPDYGSFAAHRRHYATSVAVDDDHDDGRSLAMIEMMSFDVPSPAASPRWHWKQWRRLEAWMSLDAVRLAESIDKYSRVGFPFVFIVLSVAYWTIYLQIRPAEYDDDFVLVD